MRGMSDDAWRVYLRRWRDAQVAMWAVTRPAHARFQEETAGPRSARDMVVKPAEAAFERERQAAWDEYKARVAAEDALLPAER
jgi:hypothetical protein